uniref:BZIP domain-containing protein n=1 Tax=Globodera pallida TaxID=36090 RepID=A0A183C815_GLOPA
MATQRNARKRNAAPYPSQTTLQGESPSRQQCQVQEGNSPLNGNESSWSFVEQSPSGQQDQGADEYVLKRLKNNAAVSRTRQKKRVEQVHTSQRVKELREENAQLERTLDTMRRELALLKEMVVVCAAKDDDGGRGGGS